MSEFVTPSYMRKVQTLHLHSQLMSLLSINSSSEVDIGWEQSRIAIPNNSCSQCAFTAPWLWEDVPEPESFISCSCHYWWPIRTHCQIQHPKCMASQSCNFIHLRILPNNDLVERVSMRWHQFLICLWEHQVAHLWPSVDAVDRLQCEWVPEPNALVCCPSSWSQQPSLERTPSNCLHCCLMLGKLGQVSGLMCWPDKHLVIIATWGQLVLVMETPLQAADLLLVSKQPLLEVLLCPHIPDENGSVSAACCNQRTIPCTCSYPVGMTCQTPHYLLLINVP